MINRAGAHPFEHVPGLDPAAILDGATIPRQPLLVGATVAIGEGAGAFKVYDGGQKPEFRITPSGLVIRLTQTAETDVVCEPPNYRLSAQDPADRTDVTYAGFRFDQARRINLKNGGRLLLPSRMYRSNLTITPYSYYIPELETARISRIVSDLDEARLAITSIATTVMGVDQTTGDLVADLALDFEPQSHIE